MDQIALSEKKWIEWREKWIELRKKKESLTRKKRQKKCDGKASIAFKKIL